MYIIVHRKRPAQFKTMPSHSLGISRSWSKQFSKKTGICMLLYMPLKAFNVIKGPLHKLQEGF